ncbi:50S ribosomal protein L25 [bacterium]|nr:50S ribosomal protein L25 [bacterium]MBQ6436151.1 50S ribosomal protein L25 [bacterium]
MDKYQLTAQKRDLKQKVASLRHDGQLPANIFGSGASQAITLDSKEATKLLSQISESTVIYINLDGKDIPVMLGEVQKDPIKGELIHLTLRKVNLRKKVIASIPVETTGLFSVPGAYYHLVYDEIEAEALPTDLPKAFVVDVSKFQAIGDELTFADLDYDHDKVTLKIEDEKLPVVVVSEVVEEVEEEPATPAEAEASAEGAAPAEGETPAPEAPAAE